MKEKGKKRHLPFPSELLKKLLVKRIKFNINYYVHNAWCRCKILNFFNVNFGSHETPMDKKK